MFLVCTLWVWADDGRDTLSHLSSAQLMDSGRRHFEHRQASQALACFTAVNKRTVADEADLQLRIRALNNIACVYRYLYQDPIKAYDYFKHAYALCDSLHYDEFIPVIMVNMGDLINDNSSNSKALSQQAHDIFEQCMERAFETHNWELMTTAFFNLSNQNYELPLEKYRRIFSKEIPDSTPDLQFVRLQFQGLEHVQKKEYAEARQDFLHQLQSVSARWEAARDSIAAYMSIAYTYQMENDYPHEIAYLEMAHQIAVSHGIDDQASYIGNLLVESRASLLDDRQRLQQYVIIAIGLLLSIVIGSALLLWHKNRQLHHRNRSLFEKNQLLLRAEQEELQLRKEVEAAKYSHSNLSDEHRDQLVFRIQEVLNDPETICQSDFNLHRLAKMVDSNTTYVSQVVNERYGTAFSNVLANHRVKEACQRMNDQHYSQMTIEAIAMSVGFKSRTTFINAFKREVGLTPSEYLRMATVKEG